MLDFSLRDWLWLKFYEEGLLPPDTLVWQEIFWSAIVALVIIFLWFGVRLVFFLIVQRARIAMITAGFFCGCSALAWLAGSLELFGHRSFSFMTVLIILALICSSIYLIWEGEKR